MEANWQETVMMQEALCNLANHDKDNHCNPQEDCEVCKTNKQAEISFKAGQQESDKKWRQILMDSINLAKLVGMREVVEWVEANNGHIDRWMKNGERVRHYCPNCDNSVIGVYPSEWQAKLKEWEIHK